MVVKFSSQRLHVCVCGCAWCACACVVLCRALLDVLVFCLCSQVPVWPSHSLPLLLCHLHWRSEVTRTSPWLWFAVSANPQTWRATQCSRTAPDRATFSNQLRVDSAKARYTNADSAQTGLIYCPLWAPLSNRTAGQAPSVLPKRHKYHQVGFWFDHLSVFPGLWLFLLALLCTWACPIIHVKWLFDVFDSADKDGNNRKQQCEINLLPAHHCGYFGRWLFNVSYTISIILKPI